MPTTDNPIIPIYLDEQSVDTALSYTEQGLVEEVVQRIHSEEGYESSMGIDYGAVFRRDTSDIEGQEIEFVKSRDPIAKLSILIDSLESNESIQHYSESFSESEYSNLSGGDFVFLNAYLFETPLSVIDQLFDLFGGLIDEADDLLELDEGDLEEFSEAERILSLVKQEQDILRAKVGSDSYSDFVLTYTEEDFVDLPLGFPRNDTKYSVVGQVRSKIGEGESIPLINFVDIAARLSDNPREERREASRIKRQLAGAASSVAGREITPDEFEISHPDIELRPLAIF